MTQNVALALATGGFVAGVLIGTLIEYVVHRLMHQRLLLGKVHTRHHKEGTGQGFLLEFKDYLVGALPVIALMLALGYYFDLWAIFGGMAAGALFFAAFAAYVHQAQHDRPELIFWMPVPVHHVHHTQQMWKHNFGITVDIWDRLFGTYKQVEWHRSFEPVTPLSFFRIKWV